MAAKTNGKRWLGVAIAAVVVTAVAVGAYFLLRPGPTAPGPTTTSRDVTAQVTTLTTAVNGTGTMQPAQRADLAFTSSGTVVSVGVAVGDRVTGGQALAAIDPVDLQAAVDAAQASLDAANEDLTTAKSDGTDAQITAATSLVKTKQNALEAAKTALAGATLLAPFDGTVAVVNLAVGDTVGGGGSAGQGAGGANSSGSTAITLITADRYTVAVGVGSADIGKITKGMKAQVTPSGASKALPGTVTGVGVIASTSSGSNTPSFPVTIALDEPQQGLYAGISASVALITSSRDGVLVIPSLALTRAADGTYSVEKKLADGSYAATPVSVGQVSGATTEITSGLAAGDVVRVNQVVVTATGGSGNRSPGYAGGPQTTQFVGPGVIGGGPIVVGGGPNGGAGNGMPGAGPTP